MNFDVDVLSATPTWTMPRSSKVRRGGWRTCIGRWKSVSDSSTASRPISWRDPKLTGDDVFAETLVDLLKRAAVLVSVVSPRYVRSKGTTRELSEFCRAAAAQQVTLDTRHKARNGGARPGRCARCREQRARRHQPPVAGGDAAPRHPGTRRHVRHARIPARDNLLVVVDQFEELFRFQRSRLVNNFRDEAISFV